MVSTKIDRFGWGLMADAMKDRLTIDWTDVLSPYRLAEVRRAIAAVMADRPKHATNEKQVEIEIVKARQRQLAAMPKAKEPDAPTRDPMTAEARQAIMDDVGFRGSVNLKSFNAKPEVKE